MKLLPLKVLIVFIILFLSFEISKGQLIHGNKESGEITLDQFSKNNVPAKECMTLELKESNSRPTNQANKVETIVIICPVLKHSEIRLISILTLQKIVFSKKQHSIISHYCLLISKTLHRSPFANILRI
jgi:hypothetical protein